MHGFIMMLKNTAVLLSKVIFLIQFHSNYLFYLCDYFVLFLLFRLTPTVPVLKSPLKSTSVFFLWSYHLYYVLSFKIFFVFIVLLILDFLLF